MPVRATPFLILAALAFTTAAHAGSFDLIYTDRIDVTTYPLNSGLSNGNSIALIVDTGSADLGPSDLSSISFQVSSSSPSVDFSASVLNVGLVSPVHPNEAVGTAPTGPMLARLLPGETARDVFPIGLFWFGANYPTGFTGSAVADVKMTMGDQQVEYLVQVNFTLGSSFAISYPSARRVSSVPLATPALSTTWGAIKTLYR